MQKKPLFSYVLLVIAFLFVFQFVRWGSIVISPPQTITVSGTASSQESNQIATFYAGASAVNADKQAAIDEVNGKVDEVLVNIKDFGIDPADIQTQNMSVYQDQEQYYENGAQRSRPGMWRATNSINITLRDISKASELVGILTASGLTDVSGPNYSMDDSTQAKTALLTAAVKNAREKADLLAEDQGKKVYKVLSISEGESQSGIYPMFDRAMGGGGGPVESGSTTVSTSVTVVFEVH